MVEGAKGTVKAVRRYGEQTGRLEALEPAALDELYDGLETVKTLTTKGMKLEAACRSRPLVVGVFQNQT